MQANGTLNAQEYKKQQNEDQIEEREEREAERQPQKWEIKRSSHLNDYEVMLQPSFVLCQPSLKVMKRQLVAVGNARTKLNIWEIADLPDNETNWVFRTKQDGIKKAQLKAIKKIHTQIFMPLWLRSKQSEWFYVTLLMMIYK